MDQTVRDGERNQTELASDEIMEEEGNGNLNDVICDVCFISTLSIDSDIALYLCYICNQYLCQDCFKGHESHQCIKKSEKDGQIERFLEAIRNESKSERRVMFDREEVSVVGRVYVKHELDKSEVCDITGLCGLDDTRLVVCDFRNYCIKIFSIGSHILQRYIRFGSEPLGVTTIKDERELAVTFPRERTILFIKLTQNPAVITKSIKTEKCCQSIDFSGDQLFILCSANYVGLGPWFVTVMSTDGVTIKTINIPLYSSWPDLAVCPGRVYLTDWDNHKVLCMNDKGNVVSHKTIEGSRPHGISVNPDTNNIYICSAGGHEKLYRLDSRLESFESLLDLKLVNPDWPLALCVYRNRVYIGHGLESTHVTVVRVL